LILSRELNVEASLKFEKSNHEITKTLLRKLEEIRKSNEMEDSENQTKTMDKRKINENKKIQFLYVTFSESISSLYSQMENCFNKIFQKVKENKKRVYNIHKLLEKIKLQKGKNNENNQNSGNNSFHELMDSENVIYLGNERNKIFQENEILKLEKKEMELSSKTKPKINSNNYSKSNNENIFVEKKNEKDFQHNYLKKYEEQVKEMEEITQTAHTTKSREKSKDPKKQGKKGERKIKHLKTENKKRKKKETEFYTPNKNCKKNKNSENDILVNEDHKFTESNKSSFKEYEIKQTPSIYRSNDDSNNLNKAKEYQEDFNNLLSYNPELLLVFLLIHLNNF
jgi:hypothetical protein